MFLVGDQDNITPFQSQGIGNQVDGFGGIAGEDDLFAAGCVEMPGDQAARRIDVSRDGGCQMMHAAPGTGWLFHIIACDGRHHDFWTQALAGCIEIHDRFLSGGCLQQGKIISQ